MNRYLISGTTSGLGKYLHRILGGSSYNRGASRIPRTEIIIHCAFNRTRDLNSQNIYRYLSDNILLTHELTKNPPKKFIYVSTVDVYPTDDNKHFETDTIDINKVSTHYGTAKLMAESIVQVKCPNFLILRCATLLGKDSRVNTFLKIKNEASPELTLSSRSIFNYILHKHVLDFIKIAIEENLQGIYNLASTENISLSQVAVLLKKKVNFGNVKYSVGKVDNSKASAILPVLKRTSREVIAEFLFQ